jgi:hypothetical protein
MLLLQQTPAGTRLLAHRPMLRPAWLERPLVAAAVVVVAAATTTRTTRRYVRLICVRLAGVRACACVFVHIRTCVRVMCVSG